MANMSNKKPPLRYIIHFTHSGAVCWDDGGGGGGDDADGDGDDDEVGGGDDTDGDGDDDEAGSAGVDTESDGSGGDSVVKAPTALQALLVSELIALTFQ